MSENLWNAASRIIKIAGNYELAIFNEQGDRVAIATGSTEGTCKDHAAAIIEGLQLRADKLQSCAQSPKSISTDSDSDST